MVAFGSGTNGLVVRHEHNGLLVDPDAGAKTFARAVARLAASPDLRHELANRARSSVSGHTWDDAAAELVERHYAGAVRRPATASA